MYFINTKCNSQKNIKIKIDIKHNFLYGLNIMYDFTNMIISVIHIF